MWFRRIYEGQLLHKGIIYTQMLVEIALTSNLRTAFSESAAQIRISHGDDIRFCVFDFAYKYVSVINADRPKRGGPTPRSRVLMEGPPRRRRDGEPSHGQYQVCRVQK